MTCQCTPPYASPASHPAPPPARLRRTLLPMALSVLGILTDVAHADDGNVMIVDDASGSMWGQNANERQDALHQIQSEITQPPAAATNGPAIGLVSNAGYRHLDGAGCFFGPPGARFDYDDDSTWQYHLLATLDGSKAWASIDGKVLELQGTGQGAGSDTNVRQGQAVQQQYRLGDTGIDVTGQVTDAGDTGDTGSWTVQGVMRVTQGNRQSETAIEGDCGS